MQYNVQQKGFYCNTIVCWSSADNLLVFICKSNLSVFDTNCFGYLGGDAISKTIVRTDIKGRLLTPGEGCGQSTVPNNNRIVGGTAAKKGAWPWMALFGKYYSEKYKIYTFHCGKLSKKSFLFETPSK